MERQNLFASRHYHYYDPEWRKTVNTLNASDWASSESRFRKQFIYDLNWFQRVFITFSDPHARYGRHFSILLLFYSFV